MWWDLHNFGRDPHEANFRTPTTAADPSALTIKLFKRSKAYCDASLSLMCIGYPGRRLGEVI